MLTDDEKARIRAEEQFRLQIRRELRNKNPQTAGTQTWRMLNSAFTLWVLSSVVVGTATCYYNDQRQAAESEQEDRRQLAAARREMATRRLAATIDLISHLVSGNAQESAVSQAILDKSSLAGETYVDAIRAALTTPAITPNEEATRNAIAAGYDRSGPVDASQASLRTIPPRVYVHIPVGSNWDPEVARIKTILMARGMIVMPPLKVSQRPPDQTNVRYYESVDRNDKDKSEAETIIRALKEAIPNLNTEPSRLSFSPGVRPRHYEIWFSNR